MPIAAKDMENCDPTAFFGSVLPNIWEGEKTSLRRDILYYNIGTGGGVHTPQKKNIIDDDDEEEEEKKEEREEEKKKKKKK